MKSYNKYGAVKVYKDGIRSASKLEQAVLDLLTKMEEAGEIMNLSTQVRVYLFKNPDIYYIPDFRYEYPDGTVEYAEAKGFVTPEFVIKKKLWCHVMQENLVIYTGSYKKVKATEIVGNGKISKL